jgi:hypothetical protein
VSRGTGKRDNADIGGESATTTATARLATGARFAEYPFLFIQKYAALPKTLHELS